MKAHDRVIVNNHRRDRTSDDDDDEDEDEDADGHGHDDDHDDDDDPEKLVVWRTHQSHKVQICTENVMLSVLVSKVWCLPATARNIEQGDMEKSEGFSIFV